MSRIAKKPIIVPINVKLTLTKTKLIIQGKNGTLEFFTNNHVEINYVNNLLNFTENSRYSNSSMYAGTYRSIIQSMIIGVTLGFTKKLILVGVGYRVAVIRKNVLNMFLGFSHSIEYELPIGVIVKLLSPTEIILQSANKQLLGQVAANIRSYRKPEPYKGKGIRYENELIRIKEAKKK